MNNESGISSIEMGISGNETNTGVSPTFTDKYNISIDSNH